MAHRRVNQLYLAPMSTDVDLTPTSEMVSLKMIVGWLVEYSLRYDLRQLRQQLKILFPELIKSVDFADEMTENTLYRIETLRGKYSTRQKTFLTKQAGT